ncbi:DUF1269 domain-containing protein [Stieleria sp. ICT_E10.1]|uniref:DUF1269 domain-containing protein n=1 Tax=Stieleria sedimenti TaxID=2976331 RepID=UPI00217F5872|nr:DUF1269 domain-containing protein [Stieleria sedimenti]MCS7469753.1 DUF1269 domain-containing protein [Stieleria sedimenti]
MSQNCLIAEFNSERDFRTAIEVLDKAHFTADEVSIVKHADDEGLSELNAAEDTTPASPSSETTATGATLAGGTLGAALGSMTLMGPLIVAGPIFGIAAGAVGGGLLGAVESWGVDDRVAESYQTKVRNGARLLIVTGDDIRLADAESMLKTTGPTSLETFQR